MGFAPTWPEDKKEALVRAYTRPGSTAGSVVELAAAGELPKGKGGGTFAAFKVSPNSIRDWTRKHPEWHTQEGVRSGGRAASSEAVELEEDSHTAITGLLQTTIAATRQELAAVAAAAKDGRDVTARLERAQRLALRLPKLEAAVSERARPTPAVSVPAAGAAAQDDGAEHSGGGLVGSLLADHRATREEWEAQSVPVDVEPVGPVTVRRQPEPVPPEPSPVEELAADLAARFGVHAAGDADLTP